MARVIPESSDDLAGSVPLLPSTLSVADDYVTYNDLTLMIHEITGYRQKRIASDINEYLIGVKGCKDREGGARCHLAPSFRTKKARHQSANHPISLMFFRTVLTLVFICAVD